jgi:large subunit ribosomal protein L25
MAKQAKLTAQTRSELGRNAVKKLKQNGIVPAVIYGAKEQPQVLQLVEREISTLLSHARGENILVDLEITGNGQTQNRMALIQEVQHATLGGRVLHVDFHAVNQNEKLTASVPIEPVGESNGVKNFGGLLEQSLRELEIECLPQDLPELITVDVSALNLGDSLHVKEIILPAGVTAVDDEELTVFLVTAPVAAVEPTETAPTAPEVIKEKKPEAGADDKK